MKHFNNTDKYISQKIPNEIIKLEVKQAHWSLEANFDAKRCSKLASFD